MYLDYVNDFLTVAGFSKYYGIPQGSGAVYLAFWRELHESYCADIKQAATLTRNARQFLGNLARMGPQFAYGLETETDAHRLEGAGLVARDSLRQWAITPAGLQHLDALGAAL